MARTVRHTRLETRTARLRLTVRGKPYFVLLQEGLHLGYRRLARGNGTWSARVYVGGQSYKLRRLGEADDYADADGVGVLSFAEAQAAARELRRDEERKASGNEEVTGPFTVRAAANLYLGWFREHRKSYAETKSAIHAHILPELGDVELSKVTTSVIRSWHETLAKRPARLRTGLGQLQRHRPMPTDPDEVRARRATANRLLTVLKALLNRAFEDGKVASDLAWRRVKPFQGADASRERFLEHEEMVRLCNACEPHFRHLVRADLLTGARYGELRNADVGDYSPAARKLRARLTKSGKPRWIPLDDEAVELFEQVTVGRAPTDPMFPRADGKRWRKSHQTRRLLEASKMAKIDPPIPYHCLRHSWASHRIMNGADLMVVARVLGHRDTRMVEKHYGHLRPSYVDETIRRTGTRPRLAGEQGDVIPMRLIAQQKP